MRWTKYAGFVGLATMASGCSSEDCLDGDPECVMASPCEDIVYTCEGGFTEAFVIGETDPLAGGPQSLGADGDIVLANDQVVAVIEALDHPHFIAPSGGMIIDFYRRGSSQDSLRHYFQAAGLLPGESALYTDLRILGEGEIRAVQVLGALDGHPDHVIATRYEIRPCEPGVRVRTELLNGERDAESWFLVDGWYLGARELSPFFPFQGMGFAYPDFGLSTVDEAVRDVPFLALGAHSPPAASYATTSCSDDHFSGFISREVSAVGFGPSIVMPRDWRMFERFITVADGSSVSGPVDTILEVREQLFDEPWATIRGTVVAPVGPSMVSTGLRADVVISEGRGDDSLEERTPWTHVRPAADGTFAARVPADRDYVLTVSAYGRPVAEIDASVGDSETDVGTITLPGVGELTLSAEIDGVEDHALVYLVPADDFTRQNVTGTFGAFETCAPLLGHPHGDSPSCNRLLVSGPTTVSVPPGTYDLFATAGTSSTLARIPDVVVVAGEGQSFVLQMQRLPLQPAGTLTGDFHVHGGPSFDTGINDYDRVRAFLASDLQVIATTEHEVVHDYADAIATLGAQDRLRVMVGTETTGHILFNFIPTDTNPAVVGHWNFWPTNFDPRAPYKGVPWDEKAQPGLLMERMQEDGGWDPETGVCQLNHPISGLQLGRAYGWVDSLNIDGNEPLKTEFDGTGQSMFLSTPPDDSGEGSAAFSNADFHTQEVMNGTPNQDYLKYRDFWFYLLNQGIIRAGTGNSDSHSLTENVMGVPRTIVWTDTTFDAFDPVVFNADVKAGRAIATNGPIVEISTHDDTGAVRTPSVEVFAPQAGTTLEIAVSAPPWMTIQEVRIFVNGELVREIDVTDPADPMSTNPADFPRLATSIPLAELLPASGDDAWIVVEAGPPHRLSDDLDCNGFPDTSDNNDDNRVDWRDVEDLDEDPEEDCFETVGPLLPRAVPEDRLDPLYWFAQVFPEGYPLAVTNPLILDVDGGGFDGVMR